MKKIILIPVLFMVFTFVSGQGKIIDKRDGNRYGTLTVSGVTWMTENLRYKSERGASLFNNDTNNIPLYGVLYNWKAATQACPDGWHLPSGNDFRALANFYEQKTTWGKIASDTSSFGIQLGGLQDYEGTFSEMDESGYYWTSTEYDKQSAEYFSYLLIDGMKIIDISRKADIDDIQGTEKLNKYSVRCVKN